MRINSQQSLKYSVELTEVDSGINSEESDFLRMQIIFDAEKRRLAWNYIENDFSKTHQ